MSIGLHAQLACVVEATAPKAGNVHPGARFDDTSWLDFVAAAAAIAPVFDRATDQRVGETVLQAVEATQRVTARNVNLGIILLLAPLAACGDQIDQESVARAIRSLNASDCRDVYRAIALANPGGLGRSDEADARGAAPDDLVAAMKLAASRDLVARQYVNDFADVFGAPLGTLSDALASGAPLLDAVVLTHLVCMSSHPDSLIARKCGNKTAIESAELASRALRPGSPPTIDPEALAELDRWLRADGNRRNPGTSADVVAAVLFLAFRAGIIPIPSSEKGRDAR